MPYTQDWHSLRTKRIPQWLKDGKFGIYTHWGAYSVPGFVNCWYPHEMYCKGSIHYEHHVKTYGDPSVFGYKDFIPLFKAEKFDPDEWAEIFKNAGARFAGPVGEHHDGFAMWGTAHSEWNALNMGPKRDIVAELETAIRSRGMKFMVSLHNFENWFYYPHWIKEYDTADPKYAGLYGEAHDTEGNPWLADMPFNYSGSYWYQTKPSKAALDGWLAKTKEVIDRFSPEILWFDGGLGFVREDYKKEMAAYYYNEAERKGQEVIISYKLKDMIVGSSIADIELGGLNAMQYGEWLTDTSIDRGPTVPWSWTRDSRYKEPVELIQCLVENISKNGFLLLNVGPHPDGSIPLEIQSVLREIGNWLSVNGEAVYETSPWFVYGEGPTKARSGDFADTGEAVLKYTPQDFRYTSKGTTIYAFAFAWSDEYKLTALKGLYPGEVTRVTMLGSEEPLDFYQTHHDGLRVSAPKTRPAKYLYVLKIERDKQQNFDQRDRMP